MRSSKAHVEREAQGVEARAPGQAHADQTHQEVQGRDDGRAGEARHAVIFPIVDVQGLLLVD
ncbi:MAG: hypothetical protein MUF51_03150 [Vicinamibacteria bacterium]|nr:hypothetical protein [Vicinamibacteria bacterium]